MMRSAPLPLLPGNAVNTQVGQTRFHKSHHLDVNDGLYYLSAYEKAGIGGGPVPYSKRPKTPSIYAQGDTHLPAWLAFDKITLSFDAYLKEKIPEYKGYNYLIRKCKIMFYMEDGTMKVIEKKNPKSAFPQVGCIIGRQKIPFPSTGNRDDYYDVIDLNVGKSVELLGRIFHITDCDVFTRTFLNRLGIPVSDPTDTPEDPFESLRTKEEEATKKKAKEQKKVKTLDEFLAMDSRILAFDGYWDDRATTYGYLHLVKLYYYLADETTEIKDVTEKDKPYIIVKRIKLPKDTIDDAGFGADAESTILNVIGTSEGKITSKVDPLSFGKFVREYYTDKDFAIGAVIFAYGKRVVLTDCDPFTQDFYRVKFGLDDFTPQERPLTKEEEETLASKNIPSDLPPYNGFGSYEDSALNCMSITPSSSIKIFKRFYEKDRHGYDSRILRFHGKLLSSTKGFDKRNFIICFYMVDDTVSVFETCRENFVEGLSSALMSRRRMYKPNQELFSSKTPEFYDHNSFYVGNVITLESHTFLLTGADEYALKFMELHANEFPKSNVNLIIDKVRDKVRPVYKEFAARFFQGDSMKPILYDEFRNALKDLLGDSIVEHEIITLARAFKSDFHDERFSLETLRRLTHDELKRQIWDDSIRLREAFLARDPERTGSVVRPTAYAVLRGAKLPLDTNLINLLITRFSREDDCMILYDELLRFLDYKHFPACPVTPISIPANMSWLNLYKPDSSTEIRSVNMGLFLERLNLEEELKQQCQ